MSRLVDVPPQRVYGSVPLLLPLVKMSEAEGIQLEGQPQIFDKDYPLDYSGLNFDPPWWADTGVGGGLNGVGGGNVRLLPHEMRGFGYLGLTKAQTAAQARAAAVAAAKAAGATAAAAAKQGTAAATAARQTYVAPPKATPATPAAPASVVSQATPSVTAQAVTSSSGLTAAQQKKLNTCNTKGGTWNSSSLTCTLPLTTAQTNAVNKKTCTTGGGVWDAKLLSCSPGKAQAACTANGDTWSGGQCVSSAAHTACLATTPPGTWAGGICSAAPGTSPAGTTQAQCAAQTPPGTWNGTICTPATAATTPVTCPTAPASCAAGLIIGADANGCPVCVTDPNYAATQQAAALQLQMQQCQQGGGYWNGTYCGPPPGQTAPYDPSGGGGDVSPIPPGFDSGSGSDPYGGGGMPMSSSSGGPGPQLNDQSNQIPTGDSYDPSLVPDDTNVPQFDSTTQGDDTSDNGSTDDTSNVASTSIFDSVAKLFSGMNGLSCGCDAPPPWFGMGAGGNVPPLKLVQPSYYVSSEASAIKPSTTIAVIGAAVTLMVGAAAVFLWTKGNK